MLPEVIFDPWQKVYNEGEAFGFLSYVGEHSRIKNHILGANLSIHLIENVNKVVVVTLNIESIFDIKELAICIRWKESYFLGGASDILSMLRKEPSLDSRFYHSFESLCSLENHPASFIINFSKKSSDGVCTEANDLCVLWNFNVI